MERKARVGDAFYLQTFSPVPNTDLIRVYALDRTDRHHDRDRLDRLNKALYTLRSISHLIAREKNRSRLLKGICKELIKTRGFHAAWIAVFDSEGNVVAATEAGIGGHFRPLRQQLKTGHLPSCAAQAVEKQGPVVINNTRRGKCNDCPLNPQQDCRDITLCGRLVHHAKIYGVLMVTALAGIHIDEEEISLFNEICQEIALALNNIELSERHRQSLRTIKENEKSYQDLYENAPVAYYSVDTAGNIVKINKTACKWLGYNPQELLGKPLGSIYAPENQEEMKSLAVRILQDGKPIPSEEMIYLRKDGERRYGLLSASPIKDHRGQVIATRSVVRDITELKSKDSALRRAEENFRNSIDNSPLGIRINSSDEKTRYANKALLEMYGYQDISEFNTIPLVERYTPESYAEHQERQARRRRGEPVPDG